MEDFAWLGNAGEMLIGSGGEILGHACCTGFFHEKLKLTEPKESGALTEYKTAIKAKITELQLPIDRHFLVREWENHIFTKANRELLLRLTGAFQIGSDLQVLPARPMADRIRDNNLYLYLDKDKPCFVTRSGTQVIRGSYQNTDSVSHTEEKDSVAERLDAILYQRLVASLQSSQPSPALSTEDSQTLLRLSSEKGHVHARTRSEHLTVVRQKLELDKPETTRPSPVRMLLESTLATLKELSSNLGKLTTPPGRPHHSRLFSPQPTKPPQPLEKKIGFESDPGAKESTLEGQTKTKEDREKSWTQENSKMSDDNFPFFKPLGINPTQPSSAKPNLEPASLATMAPS